MERPSTKQTFHLELNGSGEILGNHRVFGIGVLPGLAYIDLLYRHAMQLADVGIGDLLLQSVSIYRPLAVAPDGHARLAITFTEEAGGWAIEVRDDGAPAIHGAASLYATARMFRRPAAVPTLRLDVDSLVSTAHEFVALDRVYRQARKCGLAHAGAMMAAGGVHLGADSHLVDVRACGGTDHDVAYLLHPALIDGAVMACGVVLQGMDNPENDDLYLPLYYDSFCASGPLGGACRAQVVPSSYRQTKGIRSFGLRFFDDAGSCIALLEGITTAKVRQAARFLSATGLAEVPIGTSATDPSFDPHRSENAVQILASSPAYDRKTALRRLFAEYLDTEPDTLNLDLGFYELGLQSSQLLALLKDIEDVCAVQLNPTLLFECETVRELMAHLDALDTAPAAPAEPAVEFVAMPAPQPAADFVPIAQAEAIVEFVPMARAPVTRPASASFEMRLRRIFGEHLGVSAEPLSASAGFAELGLESSQLLDVMADIGHEFSVRLNPTVLFEHESLEQLASYLVTVAPEDARESATPVVSSAAAAPASAPVPGSPPGLGRYRFTGAEPFLADHIVLGKAALMGVTHPSLVVDSFLAARGGFVPVELTNIRFMGGPIRLEPDERVELEVDLANGFAVRASFADGRQGGRQGQVCCQGERLREIAPSSEAIDLQRVLSAGRRLSQTEIDRFYARTELFTIGPMLRTVAAAYAHGPDVLVSRIDLRGRTPKAGRPAFALDPLLLHSCYFYNGEGQDAQTYVPFVIGGLRLYRRVPETVYVVNSFRVKKAGFFAFDVAVYDEDGRCVARLENVSVKRISAAAIERAMPVAQAPAPAGVAALPQTARPSAPVNDAALDIAIVGMSGAYPQSPDLEVFWRNLAAGVDCITEIPADRWDWRDYEIDDRTGGGRVTCRWGGFLDGIEQFDPLFFNIPPREAERVDPQERLFLEHCWKAIEDAGYTRAMLHAPAGIARRVGVYAGVMSQEYSLFAVESTLRGRKLGLGGGVSSIATRVSYVLDLHGPSLAVDSMCSSSLTALSLACDALAQGTIAAALCGGVNLSVHPNKYLMLGQGKFVSSKGRCESFGKGGDGYIPAEGVGVLVLRRLQDAERERDRIHGVIKGIAIGHGGKASGYTVPSPKAQYRVIAEAMRQAGVDPRHVGYIEAHGTGTALGDPVEIAGLARFYRDEQAVDGAIALGSVKSNIGHCESAAGVAAITKVLLQFAHRQLVPSLHSSVLNPHIDFGATPFEVNQRLRIWPAPRHEMAGRAVEGPRLATVSSFGAGGTNGHVVLQEYVAPGAAHARAPQHPVRPTCIVLSARHAESLRNQAGRLAQALAAKPRLDDVAYTLQVGREAMPHRLGFVAESVEEAATILRQFADGERTAAPAWTGVAKEAEAMRPSGLDVRTALSEALIEAWVGGAAVEWGALYEGLPPLAMPRRIGLPTYAFRKRRLWIADAIGGLPRLGPKGDAERPAMIHPLLHENRSDFQGQRYGARISADAFFVRDHVILGSPIVPGVVQLEMARAAARHAWGTQDGVVRLSNAVWTSPARCTATFVDLEIELTPIDARRLAFAIVRTDADGRQGCCRGEASLEPPHVVRYVDLQALQAAAGTSQEAERFYGELRTAGYDYGPSMCGLQSMQAIGEDTLLVSIAIPESAGKPAGDLLLHPSVLDAALQATAMAMRGRESALPSAVRSLVAHRPCLERMWGVIRRVDGPAAVDAREFDVTLCDGDGRIAVEIGGFSMRALASPGAVDADETILCYPEWCVLPDADQSQPPPDGSARRLLVLCGDAGAAGREMDDEPPGWRTHRLAFPGLDEAERFERYAQGLFRLCKSFMSESPAQPAVIGVALCDDSPLMLGLHGQLQSLAREFGNVAVRLGRMPGGISPRAIVARLRAQTALASWQGDTPFGRAWREHDGAAASAADVWRVNGVYIVTGGAGALGFAFAKEAAASARGATLVLVGRSAIDDRIQSRLDVLTTLGAAAEYHVLDVGSRRDVERFAARVRSTHGRVHGILHSSGVTQDSLVLNKTEQQFKTVFGPKVSGLTFLDAAFADEALDFFVAFSSASAVLGNVGQSDYAAANAYMDAFMQQRALQVVAGTRRGRSLAIDWPLWEDGGMALSPAQTESLARRTGMRPLATRDGLAAFYRCYAARHVQMLVLAGNPTRLRSLVDHLNGVVPARAAQASLPAPAPAPAPALTLTLAPVDAGAAVARMQATLARLVSDLLDVDLDDIDDESEFKDFGFDSIAFTELANQLSKVSGVSVLPTVFYEHTRLRALAVHLVESGAMDDSVAPGPEASTLPLPDAPGDDRPDASPGAASASAQTRDAGADDTRVAIIGMSGRFSMADDIDEFWERLVGECDCISVVPADRWRWQDYDGDPSKEDNKTNSKWGGFINGLRQFDPLFFDISPREAELMDPQQRLLMTHAWLAIEDAGYSAKDLSGSATGLFIATASSGYGSLVADAGIGIEGHTATGMVPSIGPNRVSYLLNLHGPSEPVETACSSSLVAIHRALLAMRHGDCEMAIAGGVNTLVIPGPHVSFGKAGMLAGDGRCKTFSRHADGYVRGEGVGMLMLKNYAAAVADRDNIHATILGSAENHGGRANSLTAPNQSAQADLLVKAYLRAGVNPRTVGYIEAHGTGTKLGDPIEVNALKQAFATLYERTEDIGVRAACALGSVKTNVGHLELAAGVAGVIKVILQMRHGTIVKSLHSDEINPYIQLEGSPFHVAHRTQAWERLRTPDDREVPRRAGVSSFGFGGVNAHVILEEFAGYAAVAEATQDAGRPTLVVLSARADDRLHAQAIRLRAFLGRPGAASRSLHDIAYTLLVGRVAMSHRMAVVVRSLDELRYELDAFIRADAACRAVVGRAKPVRAAPGQAAGTLPHADGPIDLAQAGRAWVEGGVLTWSTLDAGPTPRRISLPGYAFAEEEYWVGLPTDHALAPQAAATSRLHPLLHEDTSTGSSRSFASVWSGEEFFLREHRIETRAVLPASAYLEMLCVAIQQVDPIDYAGTGALRLRNVVWATPFWGSQGGPVRIALGDDAAGQRGFEICSGPEGSATLHCQGRTERIDRADKPLLDLLAHRAQCADEVWSHEFCYAVFDKLGIQYGPTHRRIVSLGLGATKAGAREVLARLAWPGSGTAEDRAYLLHPAILDAAFQAIIGAVDPSAPRGAATPYSLDDMIVLRRCVEGEAWAHVRPAGAQGLEKYDIDLCDGDGALICRIRGFCIRRSDAQVPSPQDVLFYRQAWVDADEASPDAVAGPGRIVVMNACGVLAEDTAAAPDGHRIEIVARQGRALPAYYVHCGKVLQGVIRRMAEQPHDSGGSLQVVVCAEREDALLLGGLEGLLRAARIECPVLRMRLLVVPTLKHMRQLTPLLQTPCWPELPKALDLRGPRPRIGVWTEQSLPPADRSEGPWKEGGVYLVAGGNGGFGAILARDIAAGTNRVSIVLCGRSAADDATLASIEALRHAHAQASVDYVRCDIGDAQAVEDLVRTLMQRFGRLDGVLHCAGVLRDGLVATQSVDDFEAVCRAKVAGLANLDHATRDLPLDLFVVCSSIVAVLGNAGQSAYAAANAFMDRFVRARNAAARRGERRGHAVSINWPLLAFGGMRMPAGQVARMTRDMGSSPMPAELAMATLHRVLATDCGQMLVLHGAGATLRTLMAGGPPSASLTAPSRRPPPGGAAADRALRERTEAYLKRVLAGVTKLSPQRIDAAAELERYGIDSLLATRLTIELEKSFGSLSKTLLFEYRTLADLADHFMQAHPEALRAMFPAHAAPESHRSSAADAVTAIAASAVAAMPTPTGSTGRSTRRPDRDDIAIIGVAGRYPGADDLDQMWENLAAGRDCIGEIPASRWDYAPLYDGEGKRPGTIRTKWGGFISGVDEFDSLFFNISGREAEIMEPQERLFLQCAYAAIEDAGYTRKELAAGVDGCLTNVGVFVGVMYMEYQLWAAQEQARGRWTTVSGNPASVANRVSYYFNFGGPSVTLDTMCSSSLTSLHLARQSLQSGECAYAIAGGVNVSIHPNKYLTLAMGNFGSSQGQCASFGAGGDGYVPGEGVGAVLLKPLQRAQQDRDRIYAVLKGTAVNHGGKTNGYTVPNPQAQAGVVDAALRDAGVELSGIGYIEAHGTGTSLGDPIEISGLARVFGPAHLPQGAIAIGSVKSNIGHCESAAGIAGVTKVLLQIRHGQLAPSLHSRTLNPNIDFERTPFKVQQTLADWPRRTRINDGQIEELPRLAGVSSFGAGGGNAHVILEEYIPLPRRVDTLAEATQMVALSARTKEQLRQKSADLLRALGRDSLRGAELADLCYTLQVGREPMDERLAIVVDSMGALRARLADFVESGDKAQDCLTGSVKQHREVMELFAADPDMQQTACAWIAAGKLRQFLALWVKGLPFDWRALHAASPRRRVGLPTYPFAKERHWLTVSGDPARPTTSASGPPRHPFLERDVSDVGGRKYAVAFTGREFYLDHHRVGGRLLLPGSVYVEMARAALAGEPTGSRAGATPVVFRNVSWTKPFVVDPSAAPATLEIRLEAQGEAGVRFRIVGQAAKPGAEPELHCQGTASTGAVESSPPVDLASLQRTYDRKTVSGDECYAAFAAAGIDYGSSMQAVRSVAVGASGILAHLVLPAALRGEMSRYVIHPTMLDSAIHSAICLADGDQPARPRLAFSFAEMRVLRPCGAEMWARLSLRRDDKAAASHLHKIDIDLFDETGMPCLQIIEFTSRELPGVAGEAGAAMHLLVPRHEVSGVRPATSRVDRPAARVDQTVFVIADSGLAADLERRMPGARVLVADGRLGQLAAERAIARGPVREVVWRVGFHDAADADASSLARVQDNRVGSLFDFVKAMQAAGYLKSEVDWTVITRQAVPTSRSLPVDCTAAGLHGLVGTMAKEIGKWRFRLLDIERTDALSDDEIDALPFDPLGNGLARRNGQWLRPELSVFKPQPGGAASYREQGLYVIIGGAGGIGGVLSEHLIRRVDARVVWIGRRELDDAIQQRMDALSRLGTAPLYLSADARDVVALGEVYDRIRREHGHIDGVVVSTIGDFDVGLEAMDEHAFFSGLSAKVDVLATTFQVFNRNALDFFVCFSSLVAYTRDHGKASYSAGSVFVDAFARQMRCLEGRPIKVMNWGYWGEVGVAATVPEAFKKRMAQMGITHITAEDGMRALDTLLAGPFDQLACISTSKPEAVRKLATGLEVTEFRATMSSSLWAVAQRLKVPSLHDFGLAVRAGPAADEVVPADEPA